MLTNVNSVIISNVFCTEKTIVDNKLLYYHFRHWRLGSYDVEVEKRQKMDTAERQVGQVGPNGFEIPLSSFTYSSHALFFLFFFHFRMQSFACAIHVL